MELILSGISEMWKCKFAEQESWFKSENAKLLDQLQKMQERGRVEHSEHKFKILGSKLWYGIYRGFTMASITGKAHCYSGRGQKCQVAIIQCATSSCSKAQKKYQAPYHHSICI